MPLYFGFGVVLPFAAVYSTLAFSLDRLSSLGLCLFSSRRPACVHPFFGVARRGFGLVI
jgi:hypothetical protein